MRRRIEPVLRELGATLEDVTGFGGRPGGTLRINTAEPTARWLLQRAVPVFQERYPEVALDLFVENGLVDIVAAGFDAGVNQVGLMVEAAAAGRGIAYVPDTTARDYLDDGRLVPLLQALRQPSSELAVYDPGHRHVPAALRAFIGVLHEVHAPA